MTDPLEKRLIEALTKVDAHGDVAPAHVQDPMTMVLRQTAIQADLMRWDDSRGHYVLTGTGRSRISARSRAPGRSVALRFRAAPRLEAFCRRFEVNALLRLPAAGKLDARCSLDSWSWSLRPATGLAHPTSIAARCPTEVRPHRLGAKALYSNLRQTVKGAARSRS